MSTALQVPSHTRRNRAVLALAWPAILSYILNNAYRINDQFWIQGLGEKAQSAVGATFFIAVLNFALIFLGVGGTMALVARAVGAGDPARRDRVARHAIGFGVVLGIVLSLTVRSWLPEITGAMGLVGEARALAEEYLDSLYLFMVGIAVFPIVDSIFIGRGNTRVPMLLQLCAVGMNYVLNPILIYGEHAAEGMDAPGVHAMAAIASALGVEGRGIAGAAIATGVAKLSVSLAGILILTFPLGMRWRDGLGFQPGRSLRVVGDFLRISGPSSASIAIYAGVYLLLLRWVLSELGDEVTAGLGIGFQVFEGLAFPCYLGVAIAGSSLVGRELGARNRTGVLEVVGSVRFLSRVLGVAFTLAFWFVAPLCVRAFTDDEGVAEQTIAYVRVLAFSQYWVAVEAANEKVLLGSGRTRSILWISPLGNVLRVPLGWLLALGPFGLGARGVWWAINLTTCLKAFLFWQRVEAGTWLEEAWAETSSEDD